MLIWILRYLKGTSSFGLRYGNSNSTNSELTGCVDANFIGNLDKRRSISGYIFTLYGNTISWKDRLQSIVALSTTKSEYISLTEGIKEAIWLQGLIGELEGKETKAEIWWDSQSAICLSKKSNFS